MFSKHTNSRVCVDATDEKKKKRKKKEIGMSWFSEIKRKNRLRNTCVDSLSCGESSTNCKRCHAANAPPVEFRGAVLESGITTSRF